MASADAIARTKLLEDARAHLAFARRGFPANAGVQFHHGLVLLRLNRLAEAAWRKNRLAENRLAKPA